MTEVLIAIISLVGTALGTFGGIVTSAKLTTYRLSELEKKVDKHNNFAERVPLCEQAIKHLYHEIDDIREEVRTNEVNT